MFADWALVLTESHVERPAEVVFNAPMGANGGHQADRIRRQTGALHHARKAENAAANPAFPGIDFRSRQNALSGTKAQLEHSAKPHPADKPLSRECAGRHITQRVKNVHAHGNPSRKPLSESLSRQNKHCARNVENGNRDSRIFQP